MSDVPGQWSVKLTVLEVAESTLRTEDQKPADGYVAEYRSGTEPPNHRIAQKVDLAIVFDPEILYTPHSVS